MLTHGFTHVFWDWNGTLLDDTHFAVRVMNRILEDYGQPRITVAAYRDIFDFPVRSYYERLGLGHDGVFEVAARRFVDDYADGATACELRVEARTCVTRLVDSGLECSILSASEQEPLEQLVDYHDLRRLMSHTAGLTDHYAHGKIDAGRELLERSGADPGKTVMVGDTVHDLEVANALGIDCILVAGGHHSHAKLARTGTRVIDRLSELVG